MRKKSLNGKRVMAFALAFSLVLGEASAVVAAPADTSAAYETETVAEQEQGTESAEEAVAPESVETEVQIPETEDAEDAAPEDGSVAEAEETSVSENDTEITVSENDTDLDADEAYDGSLSKVIGLSVDESQMDDRIYDFGSYNMALRYSKKRADTTIRVQGELKQQNDYGLYAYNGKWYEYAWYSSGYDTTILSTRYEVTLKEGTTDQYYNEQTLLYTIDNVTYPYYRVSQKTVNGKTYIVYKMSYEEIKI